MSTVSAKRIVKTRAPQPQHHRHPHEDAWLWGHGWSSPHLGLETKGILYGLVRTRGGHAVRDRRGSRPHEREHREEEDANVRIARAEERSVHAERVAEESQRVARESQQLARASLESLHQLVALVAELDAKAREASTRRQARLEELVGHLPAEGQPSGSLPEVTPETVAEIFGDE